GNRKSAIPLVHQLTAVHFNRFSSEILGVGRSQKCNDRRDLFGGASPLHHNRVNHSLHLLFSTETLMKRSENDAGVHSVYANSQRREFFGESLCQCQHGTLCCSVTDSSGAATVTPSNRRNVDDHSILLFGHMSAHSLGAVEDTADVQTEYVVPIVVGHLKKRNAAHQGTGIVD